MQNNLNQNDFEIDIIILTLCLQAKFGSSYVTC